MTTLVCCARYNETLKDESKFRSHIVHVSPLIDSIGNVTELCSELRFVIKLANILPFVAQKSGKAPRS